MLPRRVLPPNDPASMKFHSYLVFFLLISKISYMELQYPFRVVTSSVDGDVLQVLAAAPSWFSAPQLDRMISHRSYAGIRSSLDRLVSQGIVETQGSERSRTYRFNEDHLAAGPLRALSTLRLTLLDRLRSQTGAWQHPPLFGALFGSAARGDMSPGSDLDIFLVRPDGVDAEAWDVDLQALGEAVTRWTGNDAQIVDLREDEVTEPLTHTLLSDVVEQGVPFIGDPDWLDIQLRSALAT